MSVVPKALAEDIRKHVAMDPNGRTHMWAVSVDSDLFDRIRDTHASETPELNDVYLAEDKDLEPGEWYFEKG